jgi:hypothetical protein
MGLFHNNDDSSRGGLFQSSSENCTALPPDSCMYHRALLYGLSLFVLDHAAPIDGTWTLQHLLTVVAAILAIITTIVSLGLGTLHLLHYTNPLQQRQ